MKVLVLGLSPYLLTSRSKVAGLIMRYLYIKEEYEVAGAVWGHDTTYFIPDENGASYYEFPIKDHGNHRIPLSLFSRGEKEAIDVYEIVNAVQPDVVITVGDYGDFLYMKAVKAFYGQSIKWLFVLLNYSCPIHENNVELLQSADGVLCSSHFGKEAIKDLYKKELIEVSYLGSSLSRSEVDKSERFRVMVSGKSHQVDNIPTAMEAVANARMYNPDIELYVHSTLYDRGDYDLELLKSRFDPNDEFITFPDKCVSLYEGLSDDDLSTEMSKSDLFVSVPLVSATSMSVFDAMSCGCIPLMSDCGSNRDVANLLASHFAEYQPEDFLIPSVHLMSNGSTYLHVCDPQVLSQKILDASKKYKGKDTFLSEFTDGFRREGFLNKLSELLNRVEESKRVISLET